MPKVKQLVSGESDSRACALNHGAVLPRPLLTQALAQKYERMASPWPSGKPIARSPLANKMLTMSQKELLPFNGGESYIGQMQGLDGS